MTEILCKWLNQDLKLTKQFEKSSFVQDFASGYYLGEIFHRYNLQDDFEAFSQSSTATAKLNNFTRLEPTLALLQIPFNTNMAYSIMMKERGIVTRLLYQIYVSLQRLEKNKLTGTAIEAMRAPAPIHLDNIQSGLYKERLKTLVPREADLTLQNVSDKFEKRKRETDRQILEAKYIEAAEQRKAIEVVRSENNKKKKEVSIQRSKLMAKISAATVNIPKPVPSKTMKAMQHRQQTKKKLVAVTTMNEISQFEDNLKKLLTPSANEDDEGQEDQMYDMSASDAYFKKIKDRLEEDSVAREERAKRRRKVLVDQMKAHHSQEEAIRQDQIVQRLLRQSQQERRIAVQLLQTRREKDVIKRNRMFQEQQFEDRRLKDYENAMDREAEMARLAKQEYAEETKREIKLHGRIMEKQRKEIYQHHYDICERIVHSLINFAAKISDYRAITDRNVPEKFIREWRRLVVEGIPLDDEPTDEMKVQMKEEKDKNRVLDIQDFEEYHRLMGDWNTGDEMKKGDNVVFGSLLYRMFKMYQPPQCPDIVPKLPNFPVKAAIIGKKFSGKTTIARQLAANHNIIPICVEDLLQEAVALAKKFCEFKTQSGDGFSEYNRGSTSLENSGVVNVISTVFEVTQSESDVREANENCEEEHVEDAGFPEDLRQRAELGAMALTHLKQGNVVPDEVLVGLVVERIERIVDGSGWILDGFPTTSNQAALLESAISGREMSPEDGSIINKIVYKKSNLIEDPKQEKAPCPLSPALHVVIHLDVDDCLIIKRATGRMVTTSSGKEYHPEFKPPPVGSFTGISAEQVVPLEDVAFDREQIQNRLLSYHNNTPKLEIFYRSASIVCHVNGTRARNAVYNDVEMSLFETLEMLQQMEHHAAMVALEEEREAEENRRKEEEPPPPPPPPPPVEEPEPKPKKGSAGKGKGSKGGSKKGSAKGRKTPTPPSPEVVVAPEPKGPSPGESCYVFVENPIEPELFKSLVPLWDKSEESYTNTLQSVFRKMRGEREEILKYLFHLRTNFKEFLKRPDHKQPFIHSWQLDYNNFDNDVRCDDETKEEMHHRVEDLCERLWDICDAKKEENEEERANLMSLGWMEDHLCVLTNLYIMMMQCEVDRFQDTVNIMRDYYTGMNGKILSEIGPAGTFLRLPLYNLNFDENSPSNDSIFPVKDSSSKPNTGGDSELELTETNSRTKIPFIPPGNAFSSQALDDGSKKTKTRPGVIGAAQVDFSTSVAKIPKDAEDKMLAETNLFACNTVANLVLAYIGEKEAADEEEEKANAPDGYVQHDKKGKSAKDKKGAKKAKKGSAGEEVPPPPPPDPLAEIKKKKQMKMKEEYFTGLRLEEERIKFRLELISGKGRAMLKYLKGQADNSFEKMQTWLGEYFDQEMAAIDHLSTTVRHFIENDEPIKYELRLDLGKCYINPNVKVIPSPPPINRPPPVETVSDDNFTIVQLRSLFSSFYQINPNGLMSSNSFHELVLATATAAYEEEIFPSSWRSVTANMLSEVISVMSLDTKQTVDWRKFLYACSNPPPNITIDKLLAIRQEYLNIDVAGNGWILEEQFDQVDLWFSRRIDRMCSPADRTIAPPYNRNLNLHSFYFHLFADHEQKPARLNYINMLMYFAMDKDPIVGFFNAMAIAGGKLMPKVSASNEVNMETETNDPLCDESQGDNQATSNNSDEQLLEMTQNYKGDKLSVDIVPPTLVEPQSWWLTLHYNSTRLADHHRFAKSYDSIDPYSMKKILAIYAELDSPNGDALPIQILLKHLLLQDAVLKTKRFEIKDLRPIVNPPSLPHDVQSPSPEIDLS